MFVVAAELGMTVRDLGARMGAGELTEWLAFFKIRANPGPAKTKEEQVAQLMGEIAAEKNAAAKRQRG